MCPPWRSCIGEGARWTQGSEPLCPTRCARPRPLPREDSPVHVLYVSKANIVATYRAKLRYLSKHLRVTAIIPDRWGRHPVESSGDDRCNKDPTTLIQLHARLHGHNHFHWYPHVERILRDVRPDLIHIDEEPYSTVTFQLALLGSKFSIPSLFFVAQTLPKWIPPPFRWTRSFVFRRTRAGTPFRQRSRGAKRRELL